MAGSVDRANPPAEGKRDLTSPIPDPVIEGLAFHSEDATENRPYMTANCDPLKEIMVISSDFRRDSPPTTWIATRVPPNPDDARERFEYCLKKRPDPDLIDALRVIEPGVRQVEILSEPAGPSAYIDIGLDGPLPLASCGVGIIQLFSIVLGLVGSRNGVLLIDQIDHGFHYSIMPGFWSVLDTLAEKHRVQVFGTTQNDDMVRSAMRSFADREGKLGLFRIDDRGDRHVMVAYGEEAMNGVLEDHFEVRG
jgi:hypothetical protein